MDNLNDLAKFQSIAFKFGAGLYVSEYKNPADEFSFDWNSGGGSRW